MSKPPLEIANIMHEVLCNFRTSTSTIFLKKIVIVIFKSDILPAFENVFKAQGRSVPVTSMKIGPLKLTVKKGDITEERVDAIVNGVGSNFDLSHAGQVSAQIKKKGGEEVQKQLSNALGETLRLTDGGKLPCNRIIHVVLPAVADKLKNCIKDILLKAEAEKSRSVSFPTIGVGSLSLSKDVVMKSMREAFEEFTHENPMTNHLAEVNVVVFVDSLYSEFLDQLITANLEGRLAGVIPRTSQVLNQLQTSTALTNFGVDEDGFVQISENKKLMGALEVAIVNGDITDQATDAIVNSTGWNFDISQGLVSKRITERGGDDIVKELSNASGKNLRVTNAGKLRCRKIIHTPSPGTGDQLKATVKAIVLKADELRFASLAIPAIGAGKKGLSMAMVARAIREALTEIALAKYSFTRLKKVDIVIFDQGKYYEFLKQLFAFRQGAKPRDIADTGRSRNPHEITLCFYCEKNQGCRMDKAMRDISKGIETDFCLRDISISDMPKVLRCKFKELLEILSKSSVGYAIYEDSSKISLSGIKVLVMQAELEIRQLTNDVSSILRLHSLPYSWKYMSSKNHWVKFERYWNITLEAAKNNKRQLQVVELPIDGGRLTFTVDLHKMSMRSEDGRLLFSVRRNIREGVAQMSLMVDEPRLQRPSGVETDSFKNFEDDEVADLIRKNMTRPTITAKIIGREGGSIDLKGNELKFQLRAFEEGTAVSLAVRSECGSDPDDLEPISSAIKCSTFKVKFKGLIDVKLPIHVTVDGRDVEILSKKDISSQWEKVETDPLVRDSFVTFQVSHFCWLRAFRRKVSLLNDNPRPAVHGRILLHDFIYYHSTTFAVQGITCVSDPDTKEKCDRSLKELGFDNAFGLRNILELQDDESMTYKIECLEPSEGVIHPSGQVQRMGKDFYSQKWRNQRYSIFPPPATQRVRLRYTLIRPNMQPEHYHLSLNRRRDGHEVTQTDSDATTFVENVTVLGSTEESYRLHLGDNGVYQISPDRHKGNVLIINNDFCGTREGSTVDVKNMTNLWQALGFHVTRRLNLSAAEMKGTCRSFANEAIGLSMVVVIIMTHGGKDNRGKEYFQGEDYSFTTKDEIIEIFTTGQSQHLRGVPKIFIFQSCRTGPQADPAVERPQPIPQVPVSQDPERADMVITYATQPGRGALRDHLGGSWLIDAITHVFMRHSHNTSLLRMLIMVNDAVARRNGGIQISTEEIYLRRELYLFPGWP